MGLTCPEFNLIRTYIIRKIPEESEYYKTENGDNFRIFKNPYLIIFQSPIPSKKLFTQYSEDLFADGTFYIAPKFSYQVFITRTYVEKKFLEYFKVNYLNKYNENNWNYYNNREHITNLLKKEESLSGNDYNREEKLICIGLDDDEIVELWYNCLIHLNNIKY
ncbi:hypothetical protein U3516DRAFT_736749 [Neocallimastix sp. 'constans']